MRFLTVLLTLLSLASPTLGQNLGSAHFENKVRPLLLKKCVACHNAGSISGNIRLDQAISKPEASALIAAVQFTGKIKMPPSGKLSSGEISDLSQWVASGAIWPKTDPNKTSGPQIGKHWAFQPLTTPKVPSVKSRWPISPIDQFVFQKLTEKGLKPNKTATRRELIRRVSYDLIGLPPTPEEVTAFELDKAPNAYEKLIDRLLASPHYGEKWGRHWLDLVRYAETNSYERDNPKPQPWRFRDYVIRSFNADKPYDQFVREQLAGDELPDSSRTNEALIATGFYRLGIWDDEPTDKEQSRQDGIDDLIVTTGQTFLGLTLDCARCHDHKIDPIPQRDYYQFAAFFNGINHFKNGGPTDEKAFFDTPAARSDYERRLAVHAEEIGALQKKLSSVDQAISTKRDALLNPTDLEALHWRYFQGEFVKLPDFSLLTPISSGSAAYFDLSVRKRDSAFGLVFDGTLNLEKAGDVRFWLDSDDGSRLMIDQKTVIDHDGSHGEGNEKSVSITLPAGKHAIRLEYIQGPGATPLGLSVGWAGPGFARRPLSLASSTSPLGLPIQLAAYKDQASKDMLAEREKLSKALEEAQKTEVPVDKALCVTEVGPSAPETFLLTRGNHLTKGAKVSAGFPECAGGGMAVATPTTQTSGRRTALASWIVSPKNPLTARVIVNRVFQYHFGHGLVRTPNDYGLQGAPPTHPELLDYLASAFIKDGWHFKDLHKKILLSNSYKQSSEARPEALQKDPQNNYLWRFDMRRLSAEEIRDSVLFVSGNLNLTQFGPSVYPEIQKEVLQGQSIPGKDWHTDQMKPEDQNRRSLYVFAKRSLLYPLLDSFDLAETDRPAPLRFASVQPTQALAMLNGAFLNRQAAQLAQRVRKDVGEQPVAFARRALALTLQRPPTADEIGRCVRLMDNLRHRGITWAEAQNYCCLAALNLSEFLYLD
jgi:hypothetical protein